MLIILTKTPGESIKIGNNIVITVIEISKNEITMIVSNPKTRTVILGLEQSETITDNIKLKILSIKNQIRLSIEFPKEARIERVNIDHYSRVKSV